jgi:hypothetical protein
MTVQESGMTIDPVVPSNQAWSAATPYLRSRGESISSLGRTVRGAGEAQPRRGGSGRRDHDLPSRGVRLGHERGGHRMQTMELTDQQSLRIAELPEGTR